MKRPLAVWVVGILFIAAGGVGFVYHLKDRPVDAGWMGVELLRVVAVAGGALLLMGKGWARWVLLAWLAFHVVVSALHSVGEFAVHLALLAVIAVVLLRGQAAEYFRR